MTSSFETHSKRLRFQSFAEWVHRHRTTFAKYQETNERNALWEERITLLKEIGFVFTVQ